MLLVLAVGAFLGTVVVLRRRRHAVLRVLGVALTLVLVLLNAAAAVNAHFGYRPTLGEALGRPPGGGATLAWAESRHGVVPSHGEVVAMELPGTRSRFRAGTAQVWLPPAWFARPRPALPVVLLLHGTPGDPSDWVFGGEAPAAADAWAARHGGVAPVLVMPDINGSETGDTECVDSPRGDVETYLTQDVPAAVARELGTAPVGRGWVVAGLSEGGSCAAMLALRHPRLFRAFADYSGLAGPRVGDTNDDTAPTVAQLFGGSRARFEAHEPASLLADPGNAYRGTGAWFEVGGDDAQPLAAARQLAPLAQRAGLDTCLVVVPGGEHTFEVWSAAFRTSLPWLAASLGLVRRTPEMTAACQPVA